MAEKMINIDGRDVLFRSTAATPRRFRNKFHEDMLSRMKSFSENVEDKQLLPGDYEFMENCAYIMCADKTKPEDVEDWLDGFDTFSILELIDQIMGLWTENLQTMEANGVEPLNQDKKK